MAPTAAQRRQTVKAIRTYGWAVVAYDGKQGVAYTVGLTVRGWPELFFLRDQSTTVRDVLGMHRLLNDLTKSIVDRGMPPMHGQTHILRDSVGAEHEIFLGMRFNTAPLSMARALYRGVRALDVTLTRYTPPESVGESTPDVEQVLAAVLAGDAQTVVFRTVATMRHWYQGFCDRGSRRGLNISSVSNKDHCFIILYLTADKPGDVELADMAHAAALEHHRLVEARHG
jgi:hypothetical protein